SSLNFPADEQFVLPQSQRIDVEAPRFSFSTTLLQAILLIIAVSLVAAFIIVIRSKKSRRETVRRVLVSLVYLAIYALVLIIVRNMQRPSDEVVPEVTESSGPSAPFSGSTGLENAVDVITITP